jgi:hypothetical protein
VNQNERGDTDMATGKQTATTTPKTAKPPMMDTTEAKSNGVAGTPTVKKAAKPAVTKTVPAAKAPVETKAEVKAKPVKDDGAKNEKRIATIANWKKCLAKVGEDETTKDGRNKKEYITAQIAAIESKLEGKKA